jgi:hypothetical protein
MLLSRNVDVISEQNSFLESAVRRFFNVLTPFVLVYFCWHGLHPQTLNPQP